MRHAAVYHLDEGEAREIVERQMQVIRDGWDEVCDLAGLTAEQRAALWGRQFLNPFALEGW